MVSYLQFCCSYLYLPLSCNSSPFSICRVAIATITPAISTRWQRKVLSQQCQLHACTPVQVIVQVPQTSASDLEAAQKAKTTMILGRAGVGPTSGSTGKPAHQQVCLGFKEFQSALQEPDALQLISLFVATWLIITI